MEELILMGFWTTVFPIRNAGVKNGEGCSIKWKEKF